MARFDERLALGIARARANADTEVTLRRDAYETPEVPATAGNSRYTVVDAEGLTTRLRVRDYLIAREEYLIDGEPVEPAAGDEFDETIGGVLHRFEVHSPGGSELAWRWRDRAQTHYRIHTREIGTEE